MDPFAPFKVVEKDTKLGFDTQQVHAGHTPDTDTKSRAVPIYSTASFVFSDAEHARKVCTNEQSGYVYTRIGNPTVEVFEKRMAALEGGSAAVATASGQSAVFETLLLLAGTGDNIVSSINLYGGTYSLFKTILPRIGITVRWVQDDNPQSYAACIDDRTKMVFAETIGNPRVSIPDLRGIADQAHARGVPLVVDNTFGAGGYWCPDFQHGVDIAVHSATKWIGGHGTTVGGCIVDGGRFDWGASASRFPHIASAADGPGESGPMSFSYWKSFGPIAFAFACRIESAMEVGACMSPFAARELLVGLETLSLRCDRIAANALRVARFLHAHPKCAWVAYPGLETDKYHALGKRFLRRGFGGVMAFGVRGGSPASCAFINALRVVSHMTNVGDCKTMATHPWSSTHSIMSEKDRLDAGISEDLIRLSVGTEDVEDIIADMSAGFDAITPAMLGGEEVATAAAVDAGGIVEKGPLVTAVEARVDDLGVLPPAPAGIPA